jgi:hypothetical protein
MSGEKKNFVTQVKKNMAELPTCRLRGDQALLSGYPPFSRGHSIRPSRLREGDSYRCSNQFAQSRAQLGAAIARGMGPHFLAGHAQWRYALAT